MAPSVTASRTISRTFHVVVCSLQCLCVLSQYSGGRPIQPGGRETFTLPPPGDPNYKTFVYNSRRYGQALPPRPFIPSYNDPNLPNPNSYDPNINRGLPPGEDPNRYIFNDNWSMGVNYRMGRFVASRMTHDSSTRKPMSLIISF
ncbi:hypothetical protein J6590_021766 [Homalodisca vitripennis]|nr:hypothetical protein J6590_021766 [Homalodisca vitripennis]